MTIFKGFLTITKRNISIICMYFVIFIVICITVQKIGGFTDNNTFEQTSLEIAVIDKDGGELAQGLKNYLGEFHTIKKVKDDEASLQQALFYRNVYYILTIPEDFENQCLKGNEKLPVTKVPESNTAFYVDQQVNTFLNDVQIMTEGGFSLTEAIDSVTSRAGNAPNVTLMDKNGHGGHMPMYAFMYQYLPYIVISILCFALGYIMIAFGQPDVKRRMECASISARSQNGQLILGYLVVGFGVWILCTILLLILYGKDFLADPHALYYIANSLILTLVCLALSFLVGTLVHRESLISAVVNVLSLGMSFTCGVFVNMDLLSKGILKFARFLPIYWYEVGNRLLSSNASLSHAQLSTLYSSYGIQLLFAAAFLAVALMLRQNMRRAHS